MVFRDGVCADRGWLGSNLGRYHDTTLKPWNGLGGWILFNNKFFHYSLAHGRASRVMFWDRRGF